MTRALALVCLAIALTGCGGSEDEVTTQEALAAFRAAGFTGLTVLSAAEALERSGGAPPGTTVDRPDEDTIFTQHAGFPYVPLLAFRLASADVAKDTFEHGYSEDTLETGFGASSRSDLPAGFDVEKLRTARVCNVVLASYDAGGDSTLADRFERAVERLRDRC